MVIVTSLQLAGGSNNEPGALLGQPCYGASSEHSNLSANIRRCLSAIAQAPRAAIMRRIDCRVPHVHWRALHPRLLRQESAGLAEAIRRALRARRRHSVRLFLPDATIRQQHRVAGAAA